MLKGAGYRVLGRQVVTRAGEADLVCEAPDGVTIVVVEVKTRSATAAAFAAPELAVDPAKQRRLVAVARELARLNGWRDRPIRIDVVAAEHDGDATSGGRGAWRIRHHPGAVRAGD